MAELNQNSGSQFANTPEGQRVIQQPDGRYLATDGTIQANFGIAAMRSRTPAEVEAYRQKDISDELYRQSANAKADTFLSRNISKWVNDIPAIYSAVSTAGALGAFGGEAGAAAGGMMSGAEGALTDAQMQAAIENGMLTGTNTLADASVGALAGQGTTAGLNLGNAFNTAGMLTNTAAGTAEGLASGDVSEVKTLTDTGAGTNGFTTDAEGNFVNSSGENSGGVSATQGGTGGTAGDIQTVVVNGTKLPIASLTPAQVAAYVAAGAVVLDAAGTVVDSGTVNKKIEEKKAEEKKTGDTGLPWGEIVNTGLGLLGSQLNEQALNGQTAEQNRLNAANVADNRAYLKGQDADYRNYLSGVDTLQRNRSAEANAVVNNIRDSQLTPAQKALYSSQIDATQAGLLSQAGLGNLAATHDATARNAQAASFLGAGNAYSSALANAGSAQSDALLGAAGKASDMAKFTPYGITTRFGKSDETGNYKLTDDIKAQQDALMGTSQGFLKQFQGAQAATAPMGEAAQKMFQTGQGYLGLSPQEQATKWMTEQQALLDPSRSAELASVNSRLAAQGRSGLSMGGSPGMMSSNPELAAYYNAKRMQDMGLSSQAMQQGMQYGTYGANMVGQGGRTLQDMYNTQSAAYHPYQTAIGGANELERLGEHALTIGTDLGVKRAAAGANAGQLFLSGASQAANAAYAAASAGARGIYDSTGQATNATYAGAANPNQYADYYAMQQAGINDQTGLQKIVGGNQADLNNAQSAYDFANPQAAGLAATAAKVPYAQPGANALAPMSQYANPANSMGGNFLTGLAGSNINWGDVIKGLIL